MVRTHALAGVTNFVAGECAFALDVVTSGDTFAQNYLVAHFFLHATIARITQLTIKPATIIALVGSAKASGKFI
jgi:hypothetical protein